MRKKKRQTHVARQVDDATLIRKRQVLPGLPTDKYSTPMPRLTIGLLTPRHNLSYDDIHDLLTTGILRSQCLFFDTGSITTQAPSRFWRFPGNQHLMFPEIIAGELSRWRSNPPNPRANDQLHTWLAPALAKCDTDPVREGPMDFHSTLSREGAILTPLQVAVQRRDRMEKYGFTYYVNLLSLRKRTGQVVEADLQRSLGRAPTMEELTNELQKRFSPRMTAIARKGVERAGKPNFDADEQLVVSAFVNAIISGMTTTIVTRDNDVFDLFLKLFELIAVDYRCHRFAYVEHHSTESYLVDNIEVPNDGEARLYFSSDYMSGVVIPNDDVNRLPPHSHHPVHCFCVLIGNTLISPCVSVAGVCLEEEMHQLLLVKGKTNGLNTDHFLPRNVVFGSDPSNAPMTAFIRGIETRVTYGGIDTTPLDLERALCDIRTKETHECIT